MSHYKSFNIESCCGMSFAEITIANLPKSQLPKKKKMNATQTHQPQRSL